jgi:cytochrome c oxidase subunit 2
VGGGGWLGSWLPANGSLHGAAVDRLLAFNLNVLFGLLILAHLILLYAVMRPRGEKATGRQPLPSAWLAEGWTIFLSWVLFAGLTVSSERLWADLRYEGPSPGAMQVEVTGVQFQWYFRYPGADARFGGTQPRLVDAATGNPLGLDPEDSYSADDIVSSILVLPEGREVDLRLRAQDVIHGFFIPGMRLKQNAVPGLLLHVHFTPVRPGIYPILCTQVCGSGHARMQAVLRVIPEAEFDSWLEARGAARKRQVSP